MTTTTAVRIVLAAGLAQLLLSIAVLAVAIIVMRQSSKTVTTLRQHRIAHRAADGTYDPQPTDPPDHEPRGADRYRPPTGHTPAVPPPPAHQEVRPAQRTVDPVPPTRDMRTIRQDPQA